MTDAVHPRQRSWYVVRSSPSGRIVYSGNSVQSARSVASSYQNATITFQTADARRDYLTPR